MYVIYGHFWIRKNARVSARRYIVISPVMHVGLEHFTFTELKCAVSPRRQRTAI